MQHAQPNEPDDVVALPDEQVPASPPRAAERTGRRCRAIEISPPFVDVAIRRWEKATGQQATIEGTNQTFVEVAAQRGV